MDDSWSRCTPTSNTSKSTSRVSPNSAGSLVLSTPATDVTTLTGDSSRLAVGLCSRRAEQYSGRRGWLIAGATDTRLNGLLAPQGLRWLAVDSQSCANAPGTEHYFGCSPTTFSLTKFSHFLQKKNRILMDLGSYLGALACSGWPHFWTVGH